MAGFMLQTEGRTWGFKFDVLCLKSERGPLLLQLQLLGEHRVRWWSAADRCGWRQQLARSVGVLCKIKQTGWFTADKSSVKVFAFTPGVSFHSERFWRGEGGWGDFFLVTVCYPRVCVCVKMAAGMFVCVFSSSNSLLCHQEIRFDVGLSPLSMAVWTRQSGLWTLPAGLLTTPHCRYDLWPQQGRF